MSNKVQTKSLYSLATINLIEARTKEALNLIKDWGLEGNLLLVTNSTNKNLVKATGNLKTVAVRSINNVCAYDMLAAKNVVVEGQALAKLAEKYA
ncbi:MAG: 50S ribosomal protein L4 [candidate division WWE3 bacterium GW2011_GWB1_44_4]|uniref:Large ribosomal subunit protein uL4 n=1 Tax=candidate division WWE3 bacterium GW2011_GWB1_44_4 TaxID=1619116 RepID=A0A0G1JFP5_UNCKA|nr:MAG: 50S ribosomal protein L4 [candidate division WWE3 bacterium GW2011_GWB1_44_4]